MTDSVTPAGEDAAVGSIDDLLAAGYRRMRLPQWWEQAYIEPDVLADGRIGPWTTLYDAGAGIGGGEPVRVLTFACSGDQWVPVAGRCSTCIGTGLVPSGAGYEDEPCPECGPRKEATDG